MNPTSDIAAIGRVCLARYLFTRLRIAAGMLAIAVLCCSHAGAATITVGSTGGNCTVSTIQAAINHANKVGGYNRILVTDDVPDGVWHENLVMQNLRKDLTLEIFGGYNNCSDLTPTGAQAKIVGDVQRWPVLAIIGQVGATLRGLRLQGGESLGVGGAGIDLSGHGRIQLTDVTVSDNTGTGIGVTESGGKAYLDLLGGVDVSGNTRGIDMLGNNVLTIRGDGNAIHGNTRNGVFVWNGVADIGATGSVFSGNGGFGLIVGTSGRPSVLTTRLYSTNPANPLTISGNTGAIWIQASGPSPYRLCTKNIVIQSNTTLAIYAESSQARLEMNSDCEYPEDANIICPAAQQNGQCNSIDNNATDDRPLITAIRGAVVTIDRVRLANNTASSILSTNPGTPSTAASSITLTSSLVVHNTLSGSVFESLDGGLVHVRDSTVAGNVGTFPSSLVGIDPAMLRVSDSIIAQTQHLLDLSGDPKTTRIDQVLAPNDVGTQPSDVVVLGVPTYKSRTFQLQPDSPGVDYAVPGGGVDFDGNPRDIDTVGIPNVHGPRDLGAYESQAPIFDRDSIFANGFDGAL
jgi:hypothetical protein